MDEVNADLLRFLDAETCEEKYDILVSMQFDLTDALIDNMAASMDFVIEDGEIEERYEQLKQCIRTRQKYEISRGRK